MLKSLDSPVKFGVGSIVGSKFKLEEKLGQGSFGMIFKCFSVQDNTETYAMKMEKRNSSHSSMLVREIKVMMELKNDFGYPRMISYGKDEDYNYVVMTNLGKNLDSLIRKCGSRFTLATCMNIAEQMITRLEILHSHNLIHRDIKPENFVIGPDRYFHMVYLIDFGLAKYYRDVEGNHIPIVEKRGMIGTARYASGNAHMGKEQSRRDDLEALGYVLLYFIRGKLPWQQIHADTKEEKYEKIKNMKLNCSLEQICEGCPQEISQYLRMVKNLEFTEEPNYNALKALFRKVVVDRKLETLSQQVDWEVLAEYRYRKKKQIPPPFTEIPTQKEIALRQQLQQEKQRNSISTGHDTNPYKTDSKVSQANIQTSQAISQANNQTSQATSQVNHYPKQDSSSGQVIYKNSNFGQKIASSSFYKDHKKISIEGKDKNNFAESNGVSPQNQGSDQNIQSQEADKSICPQKNVLSTLQSEQNKGLSPQCKKDSPQLTLEQMNQENLVDINSPLFQKDPLYNSKGTPQFQNDSPKIAQVFKNLENGRPKKDSKDSPTVQNPHQRTNYQSQNDSSTNQIHNQTQQSHTAVQQQYQGGNVPVSLMNVGMQYSLPQQLHTTSNNLLSVPNQGSLSYASLNGTSKFNHNSQSDSESIDDEGGIKISSMIISKNAQPLMTQDIRKDIRTRSLVIRQSLMDAIDGHDHHQKHAHTLNNFHGISTLKVESNQVVDLLPISIESDEDSINNYAFKSSMNNLNSNSNTQSSANKVDLRTQNAHARRPNNFIGRKQNRSRSSSTQAITEDLKEHQESDSQSNTKNAKAYKTQITPVTEVKESTYKSFKTKQSFHGENITDVINDSPICIKVIPVKRAFMRSQFISQM